MDAYKIYDEYQQQCHHEEWMKICIYCGAVLENTEYKMRIDTTSGGNTSEYFEWNLYL